MSRSLAEWLLRWRWLLLVAVVALIGFAASGLRFVHFSNDYRIFFSPENPQLVAFEELQNTYTKSDNVLFVLEPEDGRVFTPQTLETVEWLTEQAWQTPYSSRVDSITNFQHTRAEGDELIVEDLVEDAASFAAQDLQRVQAIALREPLLVNRLIAPKADVTGVNVTVQIPGIDPEKEMPEIVNFARDLADRVRERQPGMKVHLTGVVFLNNAFSEWSKRDLATLTPVMFLVITLVLAALLRSFWGTLVTLIVIFASVITAIGLALWLGIRLTPPVVSSPTMIMTLAVANCVHLLVTFLQGMRNGRNRYEAMLESLRINIQPVFITSVTTAVGFLSMNFSDAPPFRDLGNIVAAGVLASFVFCMTILPVFMLLAPVRVAPGKTRTGRAMDAFADYVVGHRRLLLWGMALVVVGLVSQVPRNELNDQFVNYFDERVDFRRDTDFTLQRLTGLYNIAYSLRAGEPGGISEPAFLQRLEAFADWYRSQPETLHVQTLTDTMKRLNRNLHGDDPAWHRIPDRRDLAAQYLLLYEMSLPYGLDLNDQINVDKSATRLNVTLGNLTSNQLLALEQRAQDWLREHVPEVMQADGASPAVMFSHIGKRNIRSMLGGTTIALVLISLILVVALRSLKIGLLSMIPNLVPAGMAFGLWAFTVGQVGLALSVVTGMTLGIVVDDTVHFLSKYLRARREEGMTSAAAVRYAFHTVGTALWTTSVVLMAGFLVLTWSPFELNSGMGLLTAITIGLALLADFLLLPALLMTLDGRGDYEKDRVDAAAEPAVVQSAGADA